MRTTLTIDEDLGRLLKERCKARNQSFKDVVNEALRAGLFALRAPRESGSRYVVRPFGSATPRYPDIVSTGELLELVDEVDAERPGP